MSDRQQTEIVQAIRGLVDDSELSYRGEILDDIEHRQENGVRNNRITPDPDTPNELAAWDLGVLLGYHLRERESSSETKQVIRLSGDSDGDETISWNNVDSWLDDDPIGYGGELRFVHGDEIYLWVPKGIGIEFVDEATPPEKRMGGDDE